jgi:hypothetical protein
VDSLHTWAGVKPGDHLHLDLFPTGTAITTANITVTAPTDPQGVSYHLYTSCGEDFDLPTGVVGSGFAVVGNLPVPLTIQLCSATIDLLVETSDASSLPVNSFFDPAVAIADGDAVDLTDQTYAAVASTAFDYSNINVAISAVGITEELITTKGRLFLTTGSAPVDGNTANTTIGIPAATAVAVTMSDIVAPGVVSEQQILDWGPASAAYALDLGGALLHPYATLPTFDPANHDVTWQETAGVSADFVLTQYHSFRPDATLSHDWVWTLAAPRGTASTGVYPRIPTAVFDFNTTATDSSDVRELINVKVPGGYDAVRAQIMNTDPTNLGAFFEGFVVGATGHAVIETVAPPPGLLRKHQRRRRH